MQVILSTHRLKMIEVLKPSSLFLKPGGALLFQVVKLPSTPLRMTAFFGALSREAAHADSMESGGLKLDCGDL
jgi:hypothetical protein